MYLTISQIRKFGKSGRKHFIIIAKAKNFSCQIICKPAAEEVQKDHTEEHAWTGMIQQFIETKLPDNWGKMNRYERVSYIHHPDELQPAGNEIRTKVCALEVWV
jgi:hypothetical protein